MSNKKKNKNQGKPAAWKNPIVVGLLNPLPTKGKVGTSAAEMLKSAAFGLVGTGLGMAIGKPSLLVGMGTSLVANYLDFQPLKTASIGMMAPSSVYPESRVRAIGRELGLFHDGPDVIITADKRRLFQVLVHPATISTDDTENLRVLRLLLEEVPLKSAVRLAAAITGAPRNTLYNSALTMQKTLHAATENTTETD